MVIVDEVEVTEARSDSVERTVTVEDTETVTVLVRVTDAGLDTTPLLVDVTDAGLDATPLVVDVTDAGLDTTSLVVDVTDAGLDITLLVVDVEAVTRVEDGVAPVLIQEQAEEMRAASLLQAEAKVGRGAAYMPVVKESQNALADDILAVFWKPRAQLSPQEAQTGEDAKRPARARKSKRIFASCCTKWTRPMKV